MNSSPYLELLKKTLTASIYKESSWQIVAPRNRIKKWLIQRLARYSYILLRRKPFDKITRECGRDWPFIGYTMVGHRRLENIQQCVDAIITAGVPGDLMETGVWRGGSVIFMRALLAHNQIKNRVVWVADSFEGLPKPDIESYGANSGADLSETDYLKVSLNEVKSNFEEFGLLDAQVKFLKGWFCDTLPNAPIEKLALLRLDGDLYESTIDALDALYHKVSIGGFVIVDDYHAWASCKQAVDDFRTKYGITEPIMTVDWTGAYWQVERPITRHQMA
jgi:O-methyltransferase